MFNVINVLILLYLVYLNIFNKDKFKSYELPKVVYLLIIFVILSTFTMMKVENVSRFISAYAGLIFCYLTTGFLSLAKFDYDKLLKLFIWLFVGQALFAFYQFVGDKILVLPVELTGLKPMFQSNVFGIPRVHTTYNEPSYFANALFLGVFLFLILTISKFKLFSSKINSIFYIGMTVILLLIFWLTLAKSAWLILPIPFVIALIAIFINLKSKKIKSILSIFIVIICCLFGTVLTLNKTISVNIYNQFVETVEGTSATSIERKALSDAAISLIPNNLIFGIGAGQFGTIANFEIVNNLFSINAGPLDPYIQYKPSFNYRNDVNTEKNITFNVYLELLLEYGLILFLIFAVFIIIIMKEFIMRIKSKELLLDSRNILSLALFAFIICSLGQFLFISPIYINPFFVALGLLINIDNSFKRDQFSKYG
jgi:O-antigen ligase